MSSSFGVFKLTDDDAMKFLVIESHIGTKKMDYQMEHNVWKRRSDGIHIINTRKTWEKLLFVARAIAAIENPSDVVVVSAVRPTRCAQVRRSHRCHANRWPFHARLFDQPNPKEFQAKALRRRQTGFVVDDKLIMPDLYFFRDPRARRTSRSRRATGVPPAAWRPWAATSPEYRPRRRPLCLFGDCAASADSAAPTDADSATLRRLFREERSLDMHASIKRRKDYINPAFYQALRNAYGIDEKGTCFARAVYDPNTFAADDFYIALDEAHVTRVSQWTTGRMRPLKLVHRRFRNGFREEVTAPRKGEKSDENESFFILIAFL
ncbi:hypothetical protein niasHT_010384 [Heterodera trifolii]|uniref:40S ribosomal protein SA n=1 Tax=Heterodera trifolii TaxID=157864 RepID=A0ABD2MBD6_9BILA